MGKRFAGTYFKEKQYILKFKTASPNYIHFQMIGGSIYRVQENKVGKFERENEKIIAIKTVFGKKRVTSMR